MFGRYFCQILAASLMLFVLYQIISPLFWLWNTTWGAISLIKDVASKVVDTASPSNYTAAVNTVAKKVISSYIAWDVPKVSDL